MSARHWVSSITVDICFKLPRCNRLQRRLLAFPHESFFFHRQRNIWEILKFFYNLFLLRWCGNWHVSTVIFSFRYINFSSFFQFRSFARSSLFCFTSSSWAPYFGCWLKDYRFISQLLKFSQGMESLNIFISWDGVSVDCLLTWFAFIIIQNCLWRLMNLLTT